MSTASGAMIERAGGVVERRRREPDLPVVAGTIS
jgi:hypothetical protein